jgi:hypothetical protein
MSGSRLNQRAVDRVMCLDPVHVLVACQALVARLRRLHEAAAKGVGNRAALEAAHDEACEALMNLLAVLDADGSYTTQVAACRAGLERALTSARELRFGL